MKTKMLLVLLSSLLFGVTELTNLQKNKKDKDNE